LIGDLTRYFRSYYETQEAEEEEEIKDVEVPKGVKTPDFKKIKELIDTTSINGEQNTQAGDILYYLLTSIIELPIPKL
jgi:hypothetical protein